VVLAGGQAAAAARRVAGGEGEDVRPALAAAR
jgi:hypothetical protein